MTRKGSRAIYRTARFNPANVDEERLVAMLQDFEGRGGNFKQFVVLLFENYQGEAMTPPPQGAGAVSEAQMARLLQHFASTIVEDVCAKMGTTPRELASRAQHDEGDEIGSYENNLVKGYMERLALSREEDDL